MFSAVGRATASSLRIPAVAANKTVCRSTFVALLLIALVADPSFAKASRRGTSKRKATHSSAPHSSSGSKKSTEVTVGRASNGHIKRSEQAKHDFRRRTGYPHGRPGYLSDHILPLACGGADAPSNMQWQTVAEAKAKDRVERQECR